MIVAQDYRIDSVEFIQTKQFFDHVPSLSVISYNCLPKRRATQYVSTGFPLADIYFKEEAMGKSSMGYPGSIFWE